MSRLKDEVALRGKTILLPGHPAFRPSTEQLGWHNEPRVSTGVDSVVVRVKRTGARVPLITKEPCQLYRPDYQTLMPPLVTVGC